MRSFGREVDDVDANRGVDRSCSPIGADQRALVMRRGRGDQGVVQRSAADSGIDCGAETSPRRGGGEREPGGREAALEPLQNHRRGEALTFGHPAQSGRSLERYVGD